MVTEDLIRLWGTLSRKILSSILVDDGAIFPVLEIIKNNAEWFSPKERPIWRGVVQCIESNSPPTVEAVTQRVNGDLELGYIQTVANLFNEDDNRQLVYHTKQLKNLGIWMSAKGIGQKLANIESPADLEKIVGEVTTGLTGLYADKNDRDPAAGSLDEVAWQEIEAFSGQAIPTGLNWFDAMAGGFWPGMNYWVVAPYKSGKSTLMRNLVLHAAERGHPVASYCAEGTRELFTLDCQAMLAAKILIDTWGIESRDTLRLSSTFILNSWRKHREKPVFSKDEYEAIVKAREVWCSLPIRVYDTRDHIRDLTTLQYSIKRDRLKYGTLAAYLDYSQLFGDGKTLFERQSNTALKVQEIGQNEGVAMCVLAQKNEEGIKGTGSYSPNIKGGGDAAAAADAIFVPEIDPEMRHILKVELKLSRHTRTRRGAHQIDSNSGLILRDLELNTVKMEP